MLGFLGFVSMLFVIFKKKDEQKNCVRFYRICKYLFLIFEKGMSKKIVLGFLGFACMLFLIFEKRG